MLGSNLNSRILDFTHHAKSRLWQFSFVYILCQPIVKMPNTPIYLFLLQSYLGLGKNLGVAIIRSKETLLLNNYFCERLSVFIVLDEQFHLIRINNLALYVWLLLLRGWVTCPRSHSFKCRAWIGLIYRRACLWSQLPVDGLPVVNGDMNYFCACYLTVFSTFWTYISCSLSVIFSSLPCG